MHCELLEIHIHPIQHDEQQSGTTMHGQQTAGVNLLTSTRRSLMNCEATLSFYLCTIAMIGHNIYADNTFIILS